MRGRWSSSRARWCTWSGTSCDKAPSAPTPARSPRTPRPPGSAEAHVRLQRAPLHRLLLDSPIHPAAPATGSARSARALDQPADGAASESRRIRRRHAGRAPRSRFPPANAPTVAITGTPTATRSTFSWNFGDGSIDLGRTRCTAISRSATAVAARRGATTTVAATTSAVDDQTEPWWWSTGRRVSEEAPLRGGASSLRHPPNLLDTDEHRAKLVVSKTRLAPSSRYPREWRTPRCPEQRRAKSAT